MFPDLPQKGVPIENHPLGPIIITGGAALAAIIALSKRDPPADPPRKEPEADLTTRFVAAIPEITSELNLELATATQTETFTKSSQSFLWGLDLGTSTVQITVPVTYRYHLCLRDPWRLDVREQRVIVHAPGFKAGLPPAIHTDQRRKLAVRGWCRGGTDDLMEQLEQEITPTLNQYARDDRHLGLVRAQCRQSVAELVKLWLEREGRWGAPGYTEIQVCFPGEDPPRLLH